MIRCPTCNALHPEGEACPGCLVGLALSEPPERASRTALFALVLGLTLGASVSVTGAAAMVTWMGQAASASSAPDPVALQEARDALEEERLRLADERRELEAERARLEEARHQIDEAALTVDQAAIRAAEIQERRTLDARVAAEEAARAAAARASESAMQAREAAAREAERARAARDAAARDAERASRDAAQAAARAAAEAASSRRFTGCSDLPQLEPRAALGRLSATEIDCLLEHRDGPNGEAVSSLLLLDAFSRGDSPRWEALARHHLANLHEDADLAYKLALHCRNTMKQEDSRHFAGIALAHREQWSGAVWVARIQSLHELRYRASLAVYGAQDARTEQDRDAWRDFLQSIGRPLPPELE
ncbi:MAG: hypothetical protein R3F61_27540 [Myxococcota bacterium]